jgi:hypothetical protein
LALANGTISPLLVALAKKPINYVAKALVILAILPSWLKPNGNKKINKRNLNRL